MPIGFTGSTCLERVDHDQLRTFVLCLGDERPVMQVGADRVAGPEYDVFRMLEAFRIHAGRGTDGHEVGRARARIAKAPLANGTAKLVEKGISALGAVHAAPVAHN